MPPYDYTDAPPPRDMELIPHDTAATCVLHIRAGNVGEDGMLTRTKAGDAEMLSCEFTVVDGPHKGRKFWEYLILEGTTAGHTQAIAISRGILKAILDSALGLQPNDTSPQARAARTVSLKQFEGMAFMAKIGVEKGKPRNDGSGESWPDKNILAGVSPSEQPPPFNGGGAGAAATPAATPAATSAPIARPEWAS